MQLLYVSETLQMPEKVKQKVPRLACKQVRYGFSKIPFLWSMHIIFVYTDKLPGAATVHFL